LLILQLRLTKIILNALLFLCGTELTKLDGLLGTLLATVAGLD